MELWDGMVSCGPTHRQKQRVAAREADITAAVAEEKGHGYRAVAGPGFIEW